MSVKLKKKTLKNSQEFLVFSSALIFKVNLLKKNCLQVFLQFDLL